MKRLFVFLGVLFSGLGIYGCDALNVSQEAKVSLPFGKAYNYNDILVVRAVDGDTLKLENGERVRLIGIDTPEMHESNKLYKDSQRTGQDIRTIQAMGKKSYIFTRDLVEGKRVRLEFDVEKKDRYERLLAYVYLKDGTFLNAEIVKQGYASLMTYPPNVKYADDFVKLYREARENNRGLWKE
jgi:micrococcal nuclease